MSTLQSIRWRLPLSYAGIALLATLALGTVLLTTLNGYYTQREREYLHRISGPFSRNIEQLASDGVALNDMQYVIDNHSFIARSRVRLLDPNSQVVLDTGTFTGGDFITISVEGAPPDAILSTGSMAVAGGGGDSGMPPDLQVTQGSVDAPAIISFLSLNGRVPFEYDVSDAGDNTVYG
ncbi:MAG: hypothetical protein F9K46_09555, partial [Anaerolineae bacterium]